MAKGKNDEAAITTKIGSHEYGSLWMDPEKLLENSFKLGSSFGADLKSAAARMSSPAFMPILRDCFALASVDGRKLGHNDYWRTHFLGKPKDLAAIIVWFLEVHFQDFFVELVNALSGKLGSLGESLGSPASKPE